ncbi:outer membrane beta-barrel family protein [Geofilum rubicundum]|uniref:Putative TonB-dependent receptor n=1 Tax=Geofilum rubicundum JCM 15548 TaxID=1236989 RepID=A0A0E9M2X3_9BACT|nr:outer membrane beta-barrel family protein [Geofilum rubicundum]GAO31879.1 putative TonB-dependent receptor [Geofilum rubicundum JCM 15548]
MKNATLRLFLILLLTVCISLPTLAQPRVYGTIIDGADQQPLPSATVALRRTVDSTLVAGAISNADGAFAIEEVPNGDYFLTAGFIGYQSHITDIQLIAEDEFQTGPLILQQQSIEVGEALIVAERQRGKSNGQATTWFVNNRMEAASNSGLDLLQHIPGVQVDILQNLSIQGSQRITVKVNGIVRDVAYLRQLNAGRIARIEVDMNPGSGQDADADGVLNILLKAPEVGVGGHVYAELPLSSNEHYLFPNYSLNAGFRKWQFYTSYDAEISGFDIVERSRHTLPGADGSIRVSSRQSVRQDYQSHRFHYGMDFAPNLRHQFSFYAYHNPFSNEHNGLVVQESQTAGQAPIQWQGSKTDEDRNSRSFYSLYYKHAFKGGGDLSLDASYYQLRGDNSTRYDYVQPSDVPSVLVAVKPLQQTLNFKTDYQLVLLEKWTLKSGISGERKEMEDRLSDTFNNREQVLSGYAQIGGEAGVFQVSGGLRGEHWSTRVAGRAGSADFQLFPHASLQWRVNSRHRTALAFRRSLQRPNIYQLNPYVTTLDHYSTMAGNAALRPVLRSQLQIDHNFTFASNHVGFQLFYGQSKNVISPVAIINQGIMGSQYQNAGHLRQWGFQVTGGLNLFKRISLSPYFKVFHNQNSGHELANGYRVPGQSGWGYDASLSAIVDLTKSTVAALVVQHKSPVTTFQNKYFSDALYFVSIDQTLGRHWKVGLKSALPLAGAFVYRGHEIKGADFYSSSGGTIYTSAIPLWVHVRFQLGRGGRVGRVDGVERVDRGGKGF